MTYYDDNFGHYSVESDEDVEFYNYVQKNSVLKKCVDCGKMVKIMVNYECCNSCADKRERGGDF
jgi:hypothetical protein